MQYVGERAFVARLPGKRACLVEGRGCQGIVAADADRPAEGGQHAGSIRANGVAERRQRPLADLYCLHKSSAPGELINHGPAQPADGLHLVECLIAVECLVHLLQGIVPATDAAQCHRQPLQ